MDPSGASTARRRFLLKTLGLGAAGLAAGGAGALAKAEWDSASLAASSAAASLADLRLQLDGANAGRAALELSYSTLQAQAAEWQAQLAGATSQNAQLSSALSTAQADNANLQSHLASVQAALDAANARLGHSTALVDLYAQLDAVGLDGVVEGGLGMVTGALAAVGGPAAALRSGVDAARGLLTTFENTLPEFKAAMAWLGEQVVRLKVGLWTVENAAQATANSAVTGLAAAFGGFAGFVLDHLPFNIGDKVRQTLAAVQSVLTGTNDMTSQAGDKVLLKISKHVDEGPQHWSQTLVAPLRTQTLAPADEVLASVAGAESAYATSLKDPATAAIAQRRALREQIAAYRAANGI
jgi:hypothetical protein